MPRIGGPLIINVFLQIIQNRTREGSGKDGVGRKGKTRREEEAMTKEKNTEKIHFCPMELIAIIINSHF